MTQTEVASFEQSFVNLNDAINGGAERALPVAPEPKNYYPRVPDTIEDTGLPPAVIEQLLFKKLHFEGEMIGRDLALCLGLKFSLIEPTLDQMRRHRMAEVKGSLGFGNISSVFALSELGRARAREFLDDNQYCGAAPVPVAQYIEAVRQQRLPKGWLSREELASAYKHMVVSSEVLGQIGPAINSWKSFLIYGRPGNGKTYLAEALAKLNSSPIYIPHAIECNGSIIQLYDPVYHRRAEDLDGSGGSVAFGPGYDRRWVCCKRPFLVSGGELSLDKLDLSYNAASKIYDAPFQLKANNGIYLIDDFGRQKASPAEVLNRWIVPMDRRVDYLNFHSGGKVEVPFETFLIFSTNLRPEQLGDEAFLRRIQYKMLLKSPGEAEFIEIFERQCAAEGLDCPDEILVGFLEKHYPEGRRLRRCHPRDIISHAIDLIHFDKLPSVLTQDILDRAFHGCFVDTAGLDD